MRKQSLCSHEARDTIVGARSEKRAGWAFSVVDVRGRPCGASGCGWARLVLRVGHLNPVFQGSKPIGKGRLKLPRSTLSRSCGKLASCTHLRPRAGDASGPRLRFLRSLQDEKLGVSGGHRRKTSLEPGAERTFQSREGKIPAHLERVGCLGVTDKVNG